MSNDTMVQESVSTPQERRKVLWATMAGTTIEWYDFFIYANMAALILAEVFFNPAGDGVIAQLLAFMSIGVSFIFRPIGAIIAGYLGDKIGRKSLLVITLLSMGIATAAIGMVPSYAAIGIIAPLLVLLCRVVQGLSTGGEWAGAAIMAVEYAPADQRGRYGAWPQLGASAGMLLATGVIWGLRAALPAGAFEAWGWRVPFLLSIVLVVVGYAIRRAVDESPVFGELAARRGVEKNPVRTLIKTSWRPVIQASLIHAGVNATGYMILGGYILNYASKNKGMDVNALLLMIMVVNVLWMFTTVYAARLSDRIGRVRTYQIGFGILIVWALPMFMLIDTGTLVGAAIALLGLGVGLGLAYGQQAALYTELFPADVRFSGTSISYAIGSVLGGGFAPLIAASLQSSTGWSGSVAIYLIVLAVVGLIAVSTIKDRTGKPLMISSGTEK